MLYLLSDSSGYDVFTYKTLLDLFAHKYELPRRISQIHSPAVHRLQVDCISGLKVGHEHPGVGLVAVDVALALDQEGVASGDQVRLEVLVVGRAGHGEGVGAGFGYCEGAVEVHPAPDVGQEAGERDDAAVAIYISGSPEYVIAN